jgi:hypothetical protein
MSLEAGHLFEEDAVLKRICADLNDSSEGLDRETLRALNCKLARLNKFSRDSYKAMFQLKN